jgi:hypothetical protein
MANVIDDYVCIGGENLSRTKFMLDHVFTCIDKRLLGSAA